MPAVRRVPLPAHQPVLALACRWMGVGAGEGQCGWVAWRAAELAKQVSRLVAAGSRQLDVHRRSSSPVLAPCLSSSSCSLRSGCCHSRASLAPADRLAGFTPLTSTTRADQQRPDSTSALLIPAAAAGDAAAVEAAAPLALDVVPVAVLGLAAEASPSASPLISKLQVGRRVRGDKHES